MACSVPCVSLAYDDSDRGGCDQFGGPSQPGVVNRCAVVNGN